MVVGGCGWLWQVAYFSITLLLTLVRKKQDKKASLEIQSVPIMLCT